MSVLAELKPKSFFKYFEEISKIPRGSSNTKQISDYLVDFARKRKLYFQQDEFNNVIIWKSGTKGYERSEPVILQGHMDMVCVKEPECTKDLEKEGLDLEYKDGFVSAKGTSLGADDGVYIAYILSILESDEIEHPPIEAIFTVDEETGMLGAKNIDLGKIRGRKMLNLDSSEESELFISCAGGAVVTCAVMGERINVSGYPVTIEVSGLAGGHSGEGIHKGTANANKLLGRLLYVLNRDFTIFCKKIDGGEADNVIPKSAKIELILDLTTSLDDFYEVIKAFDTNFKNELSITDKNYTLDVNILHDAKKLQDEYEAFDRISTDKIINMLQSFPNGVISMSHDIEGMVQTSLNLGTIVTDIDNSTVKYKFCIRSSVVSEKNMLVDTIEAIANAYGAKFVKEGDYPAWQYNPDSKLVDIVVNQYEKLFNKKLNVVSIHAGLECGFFDEKLPGLDCVSFGPNLYDIHTFNEKMDVNSVKNIWELLLEVLKELK